MSIYPINDFLSTATAINLATAATLNSFGPAKTSATAYAPATTVKTPPPPPRQIVDTVKLSEDARVQLLTQQGQTPAQIANALGLPVATIDSDLYITPTSTVIPVAPAPSFSLAA